MILLYLIMIVLFGCSGLEESQQEKMKQNNVVREKIFRKSGDNFYAIQAPAQQKRERYPWEENYEGSFAKITKEYFRCKGSSSSPIKTYTTAKQDVVHLIDCRGSDHHSLPIVQEKEFVYPILIQLLNYIQTRTGKKVVITCGHRCPAHNNYSDPSPANQSSKHMIGAEVDFYVQGMEEQPEEIVKLLIQFYENDKEYGKFLRSQEHKSTVIAPWYNKEVLVKLYLKHEGRDIDNRHPYPYISLQVRYDRERKEKVGFSFEKAQNGYQRH